MNAIRSIASKETIYYEKEMEGATSSQHSEGPKEISTTASVTLKPGVAKIDRVAQSRFAQMHPVAKFFVGLVTIITSFVGIGLILAKYLSSAPIAQRESAETLNLAAKQQNAQKQPETPMTLESLKTKMAELPKDEQHTITTSQHGTAIALGQKRSQQDCVIKGSFQWGDGEARVSGVADGHGASDKVAKYVSEQLIKDLENDLKGKSPTLANFKQAIEKIVEQYQKFPPEGSGTTLTGSIILPNGEVFAFNVGDSKTILVQDDKPTPLSADQSFKASEEMQNRYIPSPPVGTPTVTVKASSNESSTVLGERQTWHDDKYTYLSVSWESAMKSAHMETRRRYPIDQYKLTYPHNLFGTNAPYDRSLETSFKTQGGEILQVVGGKNYSSEMYSEIGAAEFEPIPQATHIHSSSGDYVISGSDGLFDVFTNHEIHSLVQEMKASGYNEEKMAEALVAAALIRRDTLDKHDNISVTVTKV